jgi:hypothetical protein
VSAETETREQLIKGLRQMNRTLAAMGCPHSTLVPIATASRLETEDLAALLRAEGRRLVKLRQSEDEAL